MKVFLKPGVVDAVVLVVFELVAPVALAVKVAPVAAAPVDAVVVAVAVSAVVVGEVPVVDFVEELDDAIAETQGLD